MKKILLLFILPLLLSSCVSMLNDKTYVVKIQSNEANAKVKIQDSIYTLPVTTEIERSKDDLVFTVVKAPKNMEFRVKRKLSGKLLLNIPVALIPPFIPGLILEGIDLASDNKYHYGKSFYLNTKDSTVTVKQPIWILHKDYIPTRYRRNKGDFYLHLSLPYYNFFHLKPVAEGAKTTDGFIGLSAGLDYFHSKKQYLNFSVSYIRDHWLPLPIDGERMDEVYHDEKSYSSFISLTNNHKIEFISIGYGLLYGKNTWHVEDSHFNDSKVIVSGDIDKSYNVLGLVFPTYFQIGPSFNIGFIYRPIFYRFTNTDQYQYEHTMSIDFAWKIKL